MLPLSDFRLIQKNRPVLLANTDGLGFDWNTIGKIKIRVLVTFSLFLLALFATQLVFAANLATDGQKLAKVQEAITKYESENADLRAQIARQSSLTNLSQKAKTLGFTASPKIITP